MKFIAYERTLQGTGASRRLRNADKVPGIVYGAGTPAMIELDHNALFFALKKEAFHSSILEMELAGKTQKVLLRDYQMHPWKPIVLHIDFQRVDATTTAAQEGAAALRQRRELAGGQDRQVPGQPRRHRDRDRVPGLAAARVHRPSTCGDLVKGQSLHVSDIEAARGHQGRDATASSNPVIVSVTMPKDEVEEAAAPAPVVAAAPPHRPRPRRTRSRTRSKSPSCGRSRASPQQAPHSRGAFLVRRAAR